LIKEIQTKIVESSFKEKLLPKIGKPGDKPNDLNKSVPSFRQMNEIKEIGRNSPFSPEINKFIRNGEELNKYMEFGLEEMVVNDKNSLGKTDLDFNKKDEFGMTNHERMQVGKPPLGTDNYPIELHHIGQKHDSPLAELTKTEHQQYYKILHTSDASQIDRPKFAVERDQYWKVRPINIKGEI